ncbi:MAG TPA: ester cyclase, partial [Thermomicrobiales bacterium]|nr:ester cyclase [Thermomicrobiales bacterium]
MRLATGVAVTPLVRSALPVRPAATETTHEAEQAAQLLAAQTAALMAAFADALQAQRPLAPFLAEDVSLRLVDEGRSIDGQTAVAAALAALDHGAFDARTTVTSLLTSPNHAVLEATMRGTQVGPYDGLAATGRVVAAAYAAGFDL